AGRHPSLALPALGVAGRRLARVAPHTGTGGAAAQRGLLQPPEQARRRVVVVFLRDAAGHDVLAVGREADVLVVTRVAGPARRRGPALGAPASLALVQVDGALLLERLHDPLGHLLRHPRRDDDAAATDALRVGMEVGARQLKA